MHGYVYITDTENRKRRAASTALAKESEKFLKRGIRNKTALTRVTTILELPVTTVPHKVDPESPAMKKQDSLGIWGNY